MTPQTQDAQLAVVERAVASIVGTVVALPVTELSGCRGYPLIRWSAALDDRLAGGVGPVLDRPTLSRWESATGAGGAPPAPLQIVGVASSAPWRQAVTAARQLRGFGAGCVLTGKRPATIRLSEADYAGVGVVYVGQHGDPEVLVRGDHDTRRAPRIVATRYWEERLLAHALAVGCVRLLQPTAIPEPTAPVSLWEATARQWPH
ncbi:hypothetical protein ACJH6J_27870 [Mycobacterium sp. SMC-18]|uniref:hypothetical protein n=1 Tax=unclassified Mycobacterium TaxID=2642494 RepID=UPI0038767399